MSSRQPIPNKHQPPKWAQRFVEWYCKPRLAEDLIGDLHEYFERNVEATGPRRAKLIYIVDAFKFCRSYTVRKPNLINLFINWIMIGSYIKTSSRSLVRHKLFSTINIVGLAVSMSVGLLVVAFASDLLSYDDFHEKKERIYRIVTTDQRTGGDAVDLASTSARAKKQIGETISGVETLTMLRRGFGGDARIGEAVIPVSGLWADESFFNVFTFPFLQGNPATALKEPYSLVLTEKAAIRLFGVIDVLGRQVKFDTSNYMVTGVIRDIPKLSHLRFDALGSFSTVELHPPDTDGDFYSWENIYMNHIYLLLPENADLKTLQTSIDKLSAIENATITNRTISLSLQPLRDITLGRRLQNQLGPVLPSLVVWVLGGLAFIIILSACFNYTNLSIARSIRRSREVGVRKIVGALRSHVLMQFMTESVMIALLALAFSIVLFFFLRDQFLSLHQYLDQLVVLRLSPQLVLLFVTMAVVVGLLAGILPALFFSRINAIRVLKDASSLQLFRRVSLRKGLIVVQYVFSLIFITATIVGYKQYKSFLTFDLGFNTEKILNVWLNGVKADQLAKELTEIPEVNGISKSLIVTSLGQNYGGQMKHPGSNDSSFVYMNIVDEHYLPLHEHQFMAGRNFSSKADDAMETEVIVNEQLLKRFGLGKEDPGKALGEVLTFEGKELKIVGVLQDFHYETIEDPIEPMAFRHFNNTTYGYVNVKVAGHDLPAALDRIEAVWKKLDKVHPLDAKFYDDQIEHAYSPFAMMIKVIGLLAFLAVCIASMGLFGMVVFTTETKLKQISIRKVLGASEGHLIFLLSRGFLVLLSLSALIAIPATYLFFDKVILVNFTYHEPIGLSELFIGALLVLVIATFMIASQTWKVARTNPSTVLKSE